MGYPGGRRLARGQELFGLMRQVGVAGLQLVQTATGNN